MALDGHSPCSGVCAWVEIMASANRVMYQEHWAMPQMLKCYISFPRRKAWTDDLAASRTVMVHRAAKRCPRYRIAGSKRLECYSMLTLP